MNSITFNYKKIVRIRELNELYKKVRAEHEPGSAERLKMIGWLNDLHDAIEHPFHPDCDRCMEFVMEEYEAF